MRGKIRVKATDVKELREKMEAAETLDLEVKEWSLYGDWEDSDGCPVFPRSSVEVEKVGYKYLHVPLVGPNGKQTFKIKPCSPDARICVRLG